MGEPSLDPFVTALITQRQNREGGGVTALPEEAGGGQGILLPDSSTACDRFLQSALARVFLQVIIMVTTYLY